MLSTLRTFAGRWLNSWTPAELLTQQAKYRSIHHWRCPSWFRTHVRRSRLFLRKRIIAKPIFDALFWPAFRCKKRATNNADAKQTSCIAAAFQIDRDFLFYDVSKHYCSLPKNGPEHGSGNCSVRSSHAGHTSYFRPSQALVTGRILHRYLEKSMNMLISNTRCPRQSRNVAIISRGS